MWAMDGREDANPERDVPSSDDVARPDPPPDAFDDTPRAATRPDVPADPTPPNPHRPAPPDPDRSGALDRLADLDLELGKLGLDVHDLDRPVGRRHDPGHGRNGDRNGDDGDEPAVVPPPPPEPERAADHVPPRADPAPPSGPVLPPGEAKTPPPMVDPVSQPRPGASTWYRTDEDRAKSVYRRANPWYRRLARGVVGIVFLGAAGVGLYFGARAVQAYLERDQLPAAGAEVPDIRATSFIVTSTAPAPTLDGTLTMDASTEAFEYVGRATGPQAGIQVVSPDGNEVFIRQGTGPWRAATSSDTVANDVRTAVRYLADDDNADDILPSRLRRNFVALDDEVDEGSGDQRLTRYEMTIDTRAFAAEFPLQWQDFQDDAIPGVQEGQLSVTIWLDTDDVLMRVRDDQTGWAWERLTYSEQPFVSLDPTDETQSRIVQVACVSDDGGVFWQTPFPSCAEAMDVARVLAVEAGVADAIGDPAADRSIAVLCSTMEQDEGPLPASAAEVALAAALVEQGVCRGDPTVFDSDG